MPRKPSRPKRTQPQTTSAAAAPGTASPPPGRYPLSPGEEDRLREEIVKRLLALRCRQPERCRNAACRRAGSCVEQAKTGR